MMSLKDSAETNLQLIYKQEKKFHRLEKLNVWKFEKNQRSQSLLTKF